MMHTNRKVLVPVDFSAHAARTLQAAASFCVRNDATLTLLYVMEASAFVFPENKLTPTLLPELVGVAGENLRKRAVSVASTYGVSVDSHVVCGDTTEEILRFIETCNMDVVIPGVGSNSQASNSSGGSIARRIATRTTCPVLSLGSAEKQSPLSGTAGLVRAKIKLYEDGTPESRRRPPSAR